MPEKISALIEARVRRYGHQDVNGLPQEYIDKAQQHLCDELTEFAEEVQRIM